MCSKLVADLNRYDAALILHDIFTLQVSERLSKNFEISSTNRC